MTGGLKLIRIDARYPTSPSGPETLAEFDDVAHDSTVSRNFDFANTSSSIYQEVVIKVPEQKINLTTNT